MPAAIPFIAQAVGTYLAASQVVVALVTLAASVAVSVYQKRKMERAARDAYNASLQDRTIMTATASGARSKIYGRVRNVDGIVFKGTWGPNSQNYTLVAAMAGHPIDGFETVFLNDVPVTLVSDGQSMAGGVDGGVGYYVTTAPYGKLVQESATTNITVSGGVGTATFANPAVPGTATFSMPPGPGEQEDGTLTGTLTVAPGGLTGSITSAPRDGTFQVSYQALVTTPKVRIWKYKGDPGQTLYPLLSSRFPSLLSATDKFSGMACIVIEMTYDQDVFPTGIPSVTAVMRGAKVLDTRTGVTAWTENPAMIARDWALYEYGGGMLVSDLDESSFITAANACDTATVFNTTAGNEVRPLYQCGIVCKTDVQPDDHFGEMVEAMAGQSVFSGGKLRVRAGVAQAPVAAIDDTWLSDRESVIVNKDASKQDLVNSLKPTISNADGYNGTDASATSIAYTATPLPMVRSAAYVAADGQELPRDTSFLGVTRNVHAQHICNVQLREMREAMTVQLSCNMRAWPLEVFDVVTLTLPVFGFAAKLFQVVSHSFSIDEGVKLVLKETSPAIYAVGTGIETPDLSLNTTLPLPWLVEKVLSVTVASGPTTAAADGWPQTRVLVAWAAVASDAVRQSGSIEIEYAEATGVPGAAVVWQKQVERGSATSATITGLKAGMAYVFRVRAVNTLGVAGLWSDQRAHQVALPPPIKTGQIAVGAAAQVIQGTLDPNVYTSNGTGSPHVIGIVAVTPDVDCTATAFITGEIGASNSDGFFREVIAVVAIRISDGTTTDLHALTNFQRRLSSPESWSAPAAASHSVQLTGGVAYTFAMYFTATPTSYLSAKMTSVQVRVELIKR